MSKTWAALAVVTSLLSRVDVASKALARRLQRVRDVRTDFDLSWWDAWRWSGLPVIAGGSDANRVALLYVEESVWGTTPALALNAFRFTSEDLRSSQNTVLSQELRDDRMIADVLRTGLGAEGSVNWELSYGSQDALLEGWAMEAWANVLNITGSLNAASPANTITAVAGSPSLAAVQVGQWIKTSGFTTPANNGYFKVIAKTTSGDHVLTVAGGTLATETGSGDEAIKSGGFLTNGITKKSYSVEKQFLDVALFDSFLGMRVATFEMNLAPNAIITGAFSFLGQKGADTQTATIGTGAAVAVNTNPVMNAIDHVAAVMEGGAVTTLDLTALTIRGDNNLRTLEAIANLGAIDIGLGSINLSGTLEAYFADRTMLNKFRSFTKTSFMLRLQDTLGNAYVIEVPRITFSSGQAVTPGLNQDVIARFEWSAERDPVVGKMISISRFPVA